MNLKNEEIQGPNNEMVNLWEAQLLNEGVGIVREVAPATNPRGNRGKPQDFHIHECS
jgi:hypothetical protein